MQKIFTAMAALAFSATAFAAPVLHFTPEEGTVTELTTITMSAEGFDEADGLNVGDIQVTRNGENFCAVNVDVYAWPVTITLKTPATLPGEYKVIIPESTFEFWNAAYQSQENAAVTLTYTIEGSGETDPEFTFDPASGSHVDAISGFTLNYPSANLLGVEPSETEGMTITKDGETLSGYNWSFSDNSVGKLKFTLQNSKWADTTITEPGTYEITIPAGMLDIYTMDTDDTGDAVIKHNLDSYKLTYIIDAPAYTVTPEAGNVKSLENVVVTADADRYASIEAVEGVTPTVTFNDAAYEGTVTAAAEGNVLTYTITPAPTEVGDYKVTIPAGAFKMNPAEGDAVANTEAIELNYTLVKLAEVVYDLTVTGTNPKAGEVDLESRQFETINLTMSDAAARPGAETNVTFVCESAGYNGTCGVRYSYGNILTVTLPKTVSWNGTYTLTVPAGTFGDEAWVADNTTGHANAEFTAQFVVVGGGGATAEYDLEVISTKPKAGEVDLEMVQFDSVTITVPAGCRPGADAKATLTCADANYKSEGTLRYSMAGLSGDQLIVAFDNVTMNGTYTFTLPRGSFGDEAWQADPSTGHTNEVYTCTFEVVGGTEQTTAEVDLVPEQITPSEEAVTDLSEIVIVMPEGTQVKAGSYANLSCTETNYYENIIIREGATDGTFTVTPNTAPSKEGTYMLLIKANVFGDAAYMENDKTGHTNAEIVKTWNFTKAQGIDSILNDAAAQEGVYNFQGIRVANSLEGLPAGLYIVKGKKISVK